jgi:hypothetical protein
MIDPDWFAQICCFAEPDLSGRDRDDLINMLGVEEEVFPFLIITANAFAAWPASRDALRAAAKGMTRAVSVRPNTVRSAMTETQRRDLREQLATHIATSMTPDVKPHEPARPRNPLKAVSRGTAPHLFIGAE